MPTESAGPKTYLKTFVTLMGLLVLTAGANFLHLGAFNVVAAMLISLAKALLILLFFMEVRYSRPIIRSVRTGATPTAVSTTSSSPTRSRHTLLHCAPLEGVVSVSAS